MYIDTDFHLIFIPALIIIFIFIVGYKFWEGEVKGEFAKAISFLKMNLIALGLLSLVLWLMLPSTPSLSTFGYPETIDQIQSNEQILDYLQRYNKAIVRTTEVVYWFIFIFCWGTFILTLSCNQSIQNNR